MKTHENCNELVNGVVALNVWTAPEIRILDSEDTESGPAGIFPDGGGFTGPPPS